MDAAFQQLRTRLQQDQTQGASHLAARTLGDLAACLRQLPALDVADLAEMATSLAACRPSMVPLGNALRRWLGRLDREQAPAALRRQAVEELERLQQALTEATDQLALHARGLVRPGFTLMTHSRSSAVLRVFQSLVEQNLEFSAIVTMSAPGQEGGLVAERLDQLRVPTTLITEAQMGHFMAQVDLNLSGCDTWLADGYFINKSGTYLQALAAQDQAKPFWVLADSFKDSQQTSRQAQLEEMAPEELRGPVGPYIQARNLYFELIPTRLITGRVSERGIEKCDRTGAGTIHSL